MVGRTQRPSEGIPEPGSSANEAWPESHMPKMPKGEKWLSGVVSRSLSERGQGDVRKEYGSTPGPGSPQAGNKKWRVVSWPWRLSPAMQDNHN